MNGKIKCSMEEHKEANCVSFCPECRIYMCNKCENHHSSLFKNHHSYNINKTEEIFTGFCKEKTHTIKLQYFCKNHNQLCCAACLCKLQEKGDGLHKDCSVCNIESIKEEKKNNLKENIRSLEELEKKFSINMKELKEVFRQIEKDKEELKMKIQNIFTKIRNAINEREEQLLIQVENVYNNKYFDEDIIKRGDKLPKQIKLSLEKGKLIDKEWDKNDLYSNINDCINIENNIKKINIINESIKKCKTDNKIKFEFSPKEESLNNFIKSISSLGKVHISNYTFRQPQPNLDNDKSYTLSGDDNNIITKTSPDSIMGVLCENELDVLIEEHKWKIKIIKSATKNIMVGIAPSDFDTNTSRYDNCGWYYYCYNSSLYSGPPFNHMGKNTDLNKIDNEIIVVMNMKRKSLKFIINGEDKGDSYTDIPLDKPIYPAVFLYNQNDSIEIVGVE